MEATDLSLSLLIIQIFFSMSVCADNHGVGGVLIVFSLSCVLSLSLSRSVSPLLDYET